MFRSRNRLPTLSYFHKATKVGETHCMLCTMAKNYYSVEGIFYAQIQSLSDYQQKQQHNTSSNDTSTSEQPENANTKS